MGSFGLLKFGFREIWEQNRGQGFQQLNRDQSKIKRKIRRKRNRTRHHA